MPFTIETGGSFTSTGVGVRIPLPSSADYFKTWNITQMPLAPATPVVINGEWFGSKFGAGATAVNDGIRWKKSANTKRTRSLIGSGLLALFEIHDDIPVAQHLVSIMRSKGKQIGTKPDGHHYGRPDEKQKF